jgi:hypothetical protein
VSKVGSAQRCTRSNTQVWTLFPPNFKRLLMQTTPGNVVLSFQNVKDRDDYLP